MVVVASLFGCAGFSINDCKMYVQMGKALSKQIEAEADSDQDFTTGDRWREVGALAAEAGCEEYFASQTEKAAQ